MTTQQTQELDPLAVELGANIHAVMWRQRVTQGQLARDLGVTQVSISRKLRGSQPIGAVELMRIAGALGVDAGDLLPKLPRLDSNQEPSGYVSAQVSALPTPPLWVGEQVCYDDPRPVAPVVSILTRRA